MLQSEFDRLTSRPYTEAEFSEIHHIYCYHPAVQSKKDIADLWTIGGIYLASILSRTCGQPPDVWKKQSTSGTLPERHMSTPKMRMTSCCGSCCTWR